MDFDEWEREIDWPAGQRIPDSYRDDARGGMVLAALAVASVVLLIVALLAVGWRYLR